MEDGWSPLAYRDNLLASVPEFPESEAVVDTRLVTGDRMMMMMMSGTSPTHLWSLQAR